MSVTDRLKAGLASSLRAGLIRGARVGRRRGRPRVYILLMHAWGMGGTIRATLNLAGYLAQRHDVEVLSLVRRRDEPFFRFPPGVEVTAIDDQRPAASGTGLSGLLGSRLSGHNSVLMNPPERASRAATLWTDVSLVRALSTRRTGVLIATRPALNLLAASVAPKSLVKIGQEHMNLSAHKPATRRAIASGYSRLDALVTLTARDLDDYRAAVGEGPLLATIPNAAQSFGDLRSDGSARKVIAAGRLTPQKGFGRLIAAFAEVAAVHPDWQLEICGNGPRRRHLERAIDRHGLGANVTLAGPVRDIERAMAGASIFALSSRFEGFPMVLLEAMSLGLPVVSFDCPTGPREIVANGHNGLLVPADDIDALAAALIAMIEDEDLRRRCSAGALETVESYSLDAIGPRWEQLVERLTAGRKPNGAG